MTDNFGDQCYYFQNNPEINENYDLIYEIKESSTYFGFQLKLAG